LPEDLRTKEPPAKTIWRAREKRGEGEFQIALGIMLDAFGDLKATGKQLQRYERAYRVLLGYLEE